MSHTFCDIFISLETKIVPVYKWCGNTNGISNRSKILGNWECSVLPIPEFFLYTIKSSSGTQIQAIKWYWLFTFNTSENYWFDLNLWCLVLWIHFRAAKFWTFESIIVIFLTMVTTVPSLLFLFSFKQNCDYNSWHNTVGITTRD